MRWRYLKLDFPYLIGELVIVVLGVLIALAVNGWYEDRRERQVEHTYLQRILSDLETGAQQLEAQGYRNDISMEASAALVSMLETDASNDKELLSNYLYAAQVGATAAVFSHDVTYRELVSTGNLNIISDASLRNLLTQYYRGIDDLIAIKMAGGAPFVPNARLIALTGKVPERFTPNNENKSNDVLFTPGESQRILEDLDSNRDDIVMASRRQLSLQGLLTSVFETSTRANGELRNALEQAL